MKEPVRRTKHPWLVGAVMAAIGLGYFALLSESGFQEPVMTIQQDVDAIAQLDEVDSRYIESASIDPKLNDAQAMTVGVDGRLYVAGQDAIAVFGASGAEIGRYVVEGRPKCLTVANDGTLYVAFSDHVEVLDATGKQKASWAKLDDQPYLTSIALQDEYVYVADAGNKVVIQYDQSGTILNRIGQKDEEQDVPGIEVPSPYLDLAVNDEGNLWVVNPGKLGMERYRSDGSIVTSWYRPEMLDLKGFTGCCNPTHVAFTQDGKLVTAEKGLVRIKIYDVTNGEYEELVAGSKLFPREQSLKDMVVDSKNRILVLDPRQNAIRVFEAQSEAGAA